MGEVLIDGSLVELRRIELLSKDPSIRTSPITDCHLKFPSFSADNQAGKSGSFIYLISPQSLSEIGPHKVDAGYRNCEQFRADGLRLGSH